VKYESPTTYKLKVMTKVKVLEKVKLQGQMIKIMVSKEKACPTKYTCKI
jgi:hypothetical protein